MAPGGVDMRTGRYVYSETDLSIGGEGGGLTLTRTLSARRRRPRQSVRQFLAQLGHHGQRDADQLRQSASSPARIIRSSSISAAARRPSRRATAAGRLRAGLGRRLRAARPTPATGRARRSSTPTGRRTGRWRCSARSARSAAATARPSAAAPMSRRSPSRTGPCSPSIMSASGGTSGGTQRLRSVTSSRGYALLLEGNGNRVTKACVFNLALAPAPPASCPAGALASATYSLYGAYGSRHDLPADRRHRPGQRDLGLHLRRRGDDGLRPPGRERALADQHDQPATRTSRA